MDMTKYNEDIKNAPDKPQDDGPRFPDGDYMMAVVEHVEKNKYEVPGTNPLEYQQVGLWVTFKILEGEYKGKDFKKYYGLRHPDSKACVRYGQSGLKKLYRAVNFMPLEFAGIYGKRFIATLESREQDSQEYPWTTDIVDYARAPEPQGQSFESQQFDENPL